MWCGTPADQREREREKERKREREQCCAGGGQRGVNDYCLARACKLLDGKRVMLAVVLLMAR